LGTPNANVKLSPQKVGICLRSVILEYVRLYGDSQFTTIATDHNAVIRLANQRRAIGRRARTNQTMGTRSVKTKRFAH